MKNTKFEEKLIDFKRPNMWMHTVKGSKTEHQKQIRAVEIVLIMLAILFALYMLDQVGLIELVNQRPD